jgi:hypothetical protein
MLEKMLQKIGYVKEQILKEEQEQHNVTKNKLQQVRQDSTDGISLKLRLLVDRFTDFGIDGGV